MGITPILIRIGPRHVASFAHSNERSGREIPRLLRAPFSERIGLLSLANVEHEIIEKETPYAALFELNFVQQLGQSDGVGFASERTGRFVYGLKADTPAVLELLNLVLGREKYNVDEKGIVRGINYKQVEGVVAALRMMLGREEVYLPRQRFFDSAAGKVIRVSLSANFVGSVWLGDVCPEKDASQIFSRSNLIAQRRASAKATKLFEFDGELWGISSIEKVCCWDGLVRPSIDAAGNILIGKEDNALALVILDERQPIISALEEE